MNSLILSLVVFSPLLGVLLLLPWRDEQKITIRWTALLASLLTFGLSVWMLTRLRLGDPNLQLVSQVPWIDTITWKVNYFLGVDGLSVWLVLLTTLLTPIAILSTWKAIEERIKAFMIFFLLLEVGMLGVFLAQDLVFFFVFWEFTLIPMYFLIGVWGGKRRQYAALKFFLFTMAGSIFMLLGIVWLGINAQSFSLPDLRA